MQTINFKITNITCPACVKLSEMALKKVPGISNIKIEHQTGEVSLEADHDAKAEIKDALKKADKTVNF